MIDLKGGYAVHARGGQRDRYAPVRSALAADSDPGDAAALARGYQRAGVGEIYVADLDAIAGRPPDTATLRTVADIGLPLWVDAGITTVRAARAVMAAGACRVVVGLETLLAWREVSGIVDAVGFGRVVFSLDIRAGSPIGVLGADTNVTQIVQNANSAGVGAIILLDLARVGASSGIDHELIRTVRAVAPTIDLVIGGGIRDAADLVDASTAGATGALVGTALHNGALLH